jgi:hypothetical protein
LRPLPAQHHLPSLFYRGYDSPVEAEAYTDGLIVGLWTSRLPLIEADELRALINLFAWTLPRDTLICKSGRIYGLMNVDTPVTNLNRRHRHFSKEKFVIDAQGDSVWSGCSSMKAA